MAQYRITITGIIEQHIAEMIAQKIDQNGEAFQAFIDIAVTEDTQPAHASPVWTNRQTQKCEACNGFGYTDDDGDDECLVCLGSGTVDAR